MTYVARSSILIVEDESLIAMDLEHMLVELGFRGMVSKPTGPAAEAWLASNTPSFAILDIHLRDGYCETVAEELIRRRVPFIVSSGLQLTAEQVIFAQGKRVPKPCSAELLARVLKELGISAVTTD